MKTKKIKVTIGIPAYNEELNMRYLLDDIRMQKQEEFVIDKIIIVSDGSTDNTVRVAKSTKFPLLKIVDRKERIGLNKTLNQVFSLATGDILVILSGDVLPVGENFLQNLVLPIIKNKDIGLIGGDVVGIAPKKIFERIIYNSHNLKMNIGKKIKEGNNVYMCYGGNRAFSRELYSQLRFPNDVPEDAFSYLYCISKGFKFVFQENARIKMRLPGTFKDHANQSIRFSAGKKKLEKYFSRFVIKNGYDIPVGIYIKDFIKFLLKNPFYTISYLIIIFIMRNLSKQANFNSKWESVRSTKSLS